MPVPNYIRKSEQTGIVHHGVGGFHARIKLYYLHQLRQLAKLQTGDLWYRPTEAVPNYTDNFQYPRLPVYAVVKHPDGKIEPEVIGSIVNFKMGVTDSNP